MEDTYLVLTSDHGEMFERGIIGDHMTPLLYEPCIHIPLLIMEPGQQSRKDIYSPTSAVDVLPTLARLTGQPVPPWTEGTILPPFSDTPPAADRSIFTLEAVESKEDQPLNPASLAMIQGGYKLARYWGYKELERMGDRYELYDLAQDPQELNNIYADDSALSRGLREQLLARVAEVDRPYEKG